VIVRKSAAEIEGMARAGEVVAGTIALLGELAQPGLTTGELDRLAEDFIREHGGVPTSKGYRGFPAATCISPNSMVVHGIPGAHRVEEGDLISVDVGVTLDGLVADSAYTFAIGEVDPELQRLLDVGKEALAAGIEQARAGNRVGDISHAVQRVVEGAGFSVVRSLVGHGVGRSYHEEPQIPNFGDPGRGPGRVPPRRRVVDFDPGRLHGRPFRAHRGRRRGRAAQDPHGGQVAGKGWFGTIISSRRAVPPSFRA